MWMILHLVVDMKKRIPFTRRLILALQQGNSTYVNERRGKEKSLRGSQVTK